MTVLTTDEPLLRLTDEYPARPLPAAIREARAYLSAIVPDILAIPESALERKLARPDGTTVDVRYGIYSLHELFERAEIDAVRAQRASAADGGLAAALIAPLGAARWDLHGLVAPLDEGEIDAAPDGEEWSIRRTLGHIVGGQRSYAWGTAWWLDGAFALDDPNLPAKISDAFRAALPDEEGPEQAGSIDDIRARLDAIVDLSAERLAGLPEDRLARAARWSGIPVPVSFRLSRWSSHVREHAIQIEKTLALLGRLPTEPERLVRLTLAAYGRAEAVVLGQPEADTAADIIRAAAGQARATIAEARRAAEA